MRRNVVEDYLQKSPVTDRWHIAGCTDHGFTGAVVIPALAESKRLFRTLASLAANPPDFLARFLVLVVVNHREDALPSDKEDNLQTLETLAGAAEWPSLRLAWIDAASAGREMPLNKGGVGLARKIGLDLALQRLDQGRDPCLLVSLDADTLVQPTYLPAIVHHFESAKTGGAVLPFSHQQAASLQEQIAIERYELFLRHYLLGLRLAGSPYAFHTVGSAMVCTAAAYIKSGGMNTRAAGEDFYFLQHLSRTVGVSQVQGTMVYPSPRPSHRVPFGTGRSVSRWLGGDHGAITFYRPECFRILGSWLEIVRTSLDAPAAEILLEAQSLSPELVGYLRAVRFAEVWPGLKRNHPAPERLLAAFHVWFDGLKTMKLIHHLSDSLLPRCGPEEALPGLLLHAGAQPTGNPAAQLALLRQMENLGDAGSELTSPETSPLSS